MDPLDRRRFIRVTTGAATATTAVALGAPALATPPAPAGRGRGHGPGHGHDHDRPPGKDRAPVREFRALWIASVDNIDWPSRTGLSADEQKDEFVAWLDLAEELGMNAVISQVRPTADAIWPSPFEPWSEWLSGTQGEGPGYDPLDFQVQAAHERGLEYHAWFNPYRVTMDSVDPTDLVEDHPARTHEGWTFAYGGKLYYDPGVPEVRAFVQDAMMDAVNHYDVDGVHFDDYFYPYPVEGEELPDQETYERHGDGSTSIEDWRRENVNLLVSEMHDRIRGDAPHVRFGISPFGIWRNASSDPAGSDTSGSESYEIISADSRRWVQEGWVDYINPQIYWQIGHELADYDTLVRWWADLAEDSGVMLFIGEGAYKAVDGTFEDPAELSEHAALGRSLDGVSGMVYFSATSMRDDTTGAVDQLVRERFAHPAIVPVIELPEGAAPDAPRLHHVRCDEDGVVLRFSGEGTNFAIWRLRSPHVRSTDLADARNLVAVVRADNDRKIQRYLHAGADPHAWYAVSALDRTWHQSYPSRAARPRR
ncbi:glycosyl hydrolase [Brachybacterium endophyticum]|uniref:Glycosyl hydrolase n=1 Tax=Brachybacterium endophyticum TaxID=2182385 RepID=A0A2U2RH46_9MICO|nr:family 10 glycosylhydrolase [Brachybacterium endophyticum]PWH05095.1 glycosyl hydrolase [Brachybacterium endophyticum]